MQIAHDSGRVAKKELMEQTGVGKVKATEALKHTARRIAIPKAHEGSQGVNKCN